MGKISLKDYFDNLDNYHRDIENQVMDLFYLLPQGFNYDDIKITDAGINKNNAFIKLEIINFNETNKNYNIEIYEINNDISQIMYEKTFPGAGVTFLNNKLSESLINELLDIVLVYRDYFNSSYTKEKVLSSLDSNLDDEMLEKIMLDSEKLPNFEISDKKVK